MKLKPLFFFRGKVRELRELLRGGENIGKSND